MPSNNALLKTLKSDIKSSPEGNKGKKEKLFSCLKLKV